jgi:hypothetical protein
MVALALPSLLLAGCGTPHGTSSERRDIMGEREEASSTVTIPLDRSPPRTDEIDRSVSEPSRQP